MTIPEKELDRVHRAFTDYWISATLKGVNKANRKAVAIHAFEVAWFSGMAAAHEDAIRETPEGAALLDAQAHPKQ